MKINYLAATLLLSGCATGYHNALNPILGFAGGYWDKPGPGELIKVGFSGNSFINKEKVGDYILYHCAEVANKHGKAYFVMYKNLPSAIRDDRSTEKIVGTLGGKPTDYVYILLKNESEQNAISTDSVLARMKEEIQLGGKS